MDTSSTAERLRGVEMRRLAAVVAGQASALEALHAPDFVLCTPSGDVWSRQYYLDGLADGSIDYHRFQPVTPIEVLLDSHLAVLRYQSDIVISVGSGTPGHLLCWHLDVYERDATSWRCRWSQATDSIVD